jgi:hypothetical protein
MNISKFDTVDFTTIDPRQVYQYLHEHGWKDEEKIDSRSYILSIYLHSKKHSVLLPIDKTVPDFDSRMWDLFKTLELVEQRSKSEIIPDFIISSYIALHKNTEIFKIKFKFVYEPNEFQFPAKKIGKILVDLQDLFEAVGQAKVGRDTIGSKLQKEIKSKTEISVFETFKGSFGMKLAFASNPEQLDIFQRPLAEEVSQSFLDLLRSSNTIDKEQLKQLLLQLKRKSSAKYRKFLFSLSSAKVNFFADWGSLNAEAGGQAALSYENIIGTIDFINKMEAEDPEEYEINGELLSASKIKNAIEIQDISDDRKYSGCLSEDLSLNLQVELTIGRFYCVKFREITSINPATEEEKTERTVIELSYVDRASVSKSSDL